MVVSQYNHYVYIQVHGATTVDENDDLVADEPTWELLCKGREEPNGRGEEIQTEGMKTYRFASLVQMPRGTAKVKVGTRVMVTECEQDPLGLANGSVKGLRIAGTCMKFDNGQLHCRMWL